MTQCPPSCRAENPLGRARAHTSITGRPAALVFTRYHQHISISAYHQQISIISISATVSSAYQYIKISGYQHTSISAYQHISISAHQHISISADQHISILAYQHIKISGYQHISIPAYQHHQYISISATSVYQHISNGISVYQHLSISAFQHISNSIISMKIEIIRTAILFLVVIMIFDQPKLKPQPGSLRVDLENRVFCPGHCLQAQISPR